MANSIGKLKTQGSGELPTNPVGKLKTQGSGKLPSQTVINPKENASAIMLRSGKQLEESTH